MGRNKLPVGLLSTNLDSVREEKLEQQFRDEYVMPEKFPFGNFITHPSPNPDSTGLTGVPASVFRGGNTPVPNDLQMVNVEALARSRTYREDMTTLITQQIGKCKYPPPKGEWTHSVTDLPPRGLGLTPRNFPSKKSGSEELKLGSSNRMSHIFHVESIPTSPYNNSSFLSSVTEYSFGEVFPYYCFVTYAEIVGTVCAKMHDIVGSSPFRSVVRDGRTTMKMDTAKKNGNLNPPTKHEESCEVSNESHEVAHEQHDGKKAETMHKYPFVFLFFASGNDDDVVDYSSNDQIVLTRRVENSARDESSLTETLHPPKNPNDVVCRQEDRPGTNERVTINSANNANAYNEVVSGNILTAESFRRCYSGKRKANVCMNSSTTNSTRVPLGVNGSRTTSGEKQHLQQRRLRAVQPCGGGGENVDNFATKTSDNQSGASQVSGKKVLTVTNRMATTNDTEKHLSGDRWRS